MVGGGSGRVKSAREEERERATGRVREGAWKGALRDARVGAYRRGETERAPETERERRRTEGRGERERERVVRTGLVEKGEKEG